MKIFFILMAAVCGILLNTTLSTAQNRPNRIFKKGQSDILFQVGLSATFLMDDTKVILPPIGIAYQNRIAGNYSIGFEFGHSVSESTYSSPTEPSRDYRNDFYFVGFRNTAHCDCRNMKEFDLYGGFTLGYNLSFVSVLNGTFGEYEQHHGIRPKEAKFTYSGFLGLRYACSPRISLFGEIGYGVSILKAGIGYQI